MAAQLSIELHVLYTPYSKMVEKHLKISKTTYCPVLKTLESSRVKSKVHVVVSLGSE